jgi:hypothetical protein
MRGALDGERAEAAVRTTGRTRNNTTSQEQEAGGDPAAARQERRRRLENALAQVLARRARARTGTLAAVVFLVLALCPLVAAQGPAPAPSPPPASIVRGDGAGTFGPWHRGETRTTLLDGHPWPAYHTSARPHPQDGATGSR